MRHFGLPLLFAVLLSGACSSAHKSMKVNYLVSKDKDHKMLVGVINRTLLATDTAFGWFNENSKYGQPDPIAISIIQLEKVGYKCHPFCFDIYMKRLQKIKKVK